MFSRGITFVKKTFHEFSEDEVLTRAGSVAYYAALSLAPLILLFIAITGFMGAQTQQNMVNSIENTVGKQAGQVVATIASKGQKETKAGWSLAAGIAILVFSASGVLAALQAGLNHIWEVKSAPGQGVKGWLRKRLVSMAMVLAISFLLVVSMVLGSMIGMIMPSSAGLNLLHLGISFLVYIALFAAMFKILPDVRISWNDVWIGAAITAILFALGKYAVGLYIARADYSDSFGAAGSIIALLVWVYYGCVMLFLGAEITQVWAHRQNRTIRPNRHAVHVEEVMQGDAEAAQAG